MEDLRKVNSLQLYSFWKSLAVGLLVIMGLMAVSKVLPFYSAPITAILCAGVFYTLLYNQKVSPEGGCQIVTYSLYKCTINYTLVTLILNLLTIWNMVELPKELLFINDPYIISLLLHPTCFLTLLYLYLRRHKLSPCKDCKLKRNGLYERGRAGRIFKYESYFQLRNLMIIFGILTVMVWSYYQFVYLPLSVTSRDMYVFLWITIITFIIDEVYFAYRYYNLYLDLKERDEIISPAQLDDMSAKTYLRFYVICDNKIYLDPHSSFSHESEREVYDTPFITKRSVNGIALPEVKNIIARLTGVKDGDLRFFYGRKVADMKNRSVLRYFYFLNGKPEDYPEIPTEGEWVDFEKYKKIYMKAPGKLAPMAISDLTRLATIILTEKIFDSEGRRKSKIKSYSPSFNLIDVKESELDFQDDKWIKISTFNSDRPFYELRKKLRSIRSKRVESLDS